MKILDLDNKERIWSLHGYTVNGGNDRAARSQYHLKARQLLREAFPTLTVLEEVGIPIRRGEMVYVDFYIPLRRLAFEVQGEQHFKYIPHFHHTLSNFRKAKTRDYDKKRWLEQNGITLVEFCYNETIEEWKNKL